MEISFAALVRLQCHHLQLHSHKKARWPLGLEVDWKTARWCHGGRIGGANEATLKQSNPRGKEEVNKSRVSVCQITFQLPVSPMALPIQRDPCNPH